MEDVKKQFLIDEINRFILEHNRFPVGKDMKVKNGYPSLNQYISVFGSWSEAIEEMEIKQVQDLPGLDNLLCYPNIIDKYTIISSSQMYDLSLQFPRLSMFEVSTIYYRGYLTGINAAEESLCVDILHDLYL
jgi:hypothetical protein